MKLTTPTDIIIVDPYNIAKSDDDAMAKAWKKLFLRLIFAGLLLFVPTLTATMLDIFNLTSDSNCAIVQQG